MIQPGPLHALSNCSAKLRLYAQALVEGGGGPPAAEWADVLANLPERLRKVADDIDRAASAPLDAPDPPVLAGVGHDSSASLLASDVIAPNTVLLVEDDPDSRELTRILLEAEGWTVFEVGDGPPALELLARERVGLVLMDARLVTLSGHAVVARLRQSNGPNRRTPVVGLSASPLAEERQQGLTVGMDDWLVKPLLRDQVLALRRWVAQC